MQHLDYIDRGSKRGGRSISGSRLNPVYKKKVKVEIDRMLEVGIIEPIEEYEWISPIIVQEKKQGGIQICVDLRKLNDAFLCWS
jgi:hypothetical protein